MIRIVLAALISVSAIGCSKLSAMFDMPEKMDDMNAEVARTNDTVERQPVVLAFEAMLKEEYAVDLWPIPFDLMGFAKEFGKYATVEDLVELYYVKIKQLNEVQWESEVAPTDEEIAKFNHKKQHTLVMLQAIAGLLTDAKAQQIANERIYANGRYIDDRYTGAALSLMMMRVQFIRDVMLEASLFSDTMKYAGEIEKAVEYANSVEAIARAPFAGEIGVEITGFYEKPEATETDDVIETLDPAKTAAIWTKIKNKANRLLGAEAESLEKGLVTNMQRHQERVQRVQASLVIVDQRLRDWTARP